MPAWLYSLVVMASVVQFVAWIWMLRIVSKVYAHFKHHVSSLVHYLFILLSIALTVKFTLQLGSVIPFVSKLAFGFRPIVIAYLHLVQLGVFSSRQNAEGLAKKLKAGGFDTTVRKTGSGTMSRVLVGPRADRDAAGACWPGESS